MELPNNPEAENAFLGSVFLDNGVLIDAGDTLSADDFYRASNRIIFLAMRELSDTRTPIEYVSLVECLKRHNALDKAGGIAGITNLANSMPTAKMAGHYAAMIADCSRRRKIITLSQEAASLAADMTNETAAVIDALQSGITKAAVSGREGGPVSSDEWTYAMVEWLNEKIVAGGVAGVPTGFSLADNLLGGGWQPKDLILLAARPGMGKTALALNFASNAAQKGKRVAFFSLEMSTEQLTGRLLADSLNMNSSKIQRPHLLTGDEVEMVMKALEIMRQRWKLYIDDTVGESISAILSKARRLKAKDGLDFIVIDYLQLIAGEGKAENRNQELGKITGRLKGLAKELGVPVLCLSQLSRDVEKRTNKRPGLADLRDSGSIEQDADIVMFLYRDDYYDAGTDKTWSELSFAKHRNGELGTIKLMFNKPYQRFTLMDNGV